MRRLFLLPVLLAATVAWCQDHPTDSQTLRSILEEIRLLRRDVQSSSVASQRVQIALYQLQLQDAAVARAMKLVEETHTKLTEFEAERTRVAANLERSESERDRTQDVNERKLFEEQAIPELKKHLNQIATGPSAVASKKQRSRGTAQNAATQTRHVAQRP